MKIREKDWLAVNTWGSIIGSVGLVALLTLARLAMPTFAGAQDAAATELASAAENLAKSHQASQAVTAQLDALNLPTRLQRRAERLRLRLLSVIQTESDAADAGNAKKARRRHERALLLLRKLGRIARQHLANQSDTTPDRLAIATRLARLDARLKKLLSTANASDVVVDEAALTATSNAIRDSLEQGDLISAQQALPDYVSELAVLKESLLKSD